jgi:hypothetical protein
MARSATWPRKARIEAGSPHERYLRPIDQRHGLDVVGVESEFVRQRRIRLQALRLVAAAARQRRMQVAVDPLKARVESVLADDVIDRRDRRQSRVPDGLRMIASDPRHEFGEARVGHHRQVRARVARVGDGATTTLEHDDAHAGLGQPVRGRQSGDANADDDDIGGQILAERGELREPGGRRPVGCHPATVSPPRMGSTSPVM